MKRMENWRQRGARAIALLVAGSMLVPTLAGCGSSSNSGDGMQGSAPPPPGMGQQPMQRPMQQPQAQKKGMSTGTKVAILAGAAALYYIYKKRQNAQQQAGPNGKYFLSKNGRVYYRDLKTGQFQWVSPPRQPIQVPIEEAQEYAGYQGYNNSQNGRGFGGYGTGRTYQDAVPAQPY